MEFLEVFLRDFVEEGEDDFVEGDNAEVAELILDPVGVQVGLLPCDEFVARVRVGVGGVVLGALVVVRVGGL